jgi:hypothetical protein
VFDLHPVAQRVEPVNPEEAKPNRRNLAEQEVEHGGEQVPVAQATRSEAVLPERVREALGQLVGAERGRACWR